MSQRIREFNLQPDPRILPMLGEINLLQWKCLAEFIDNSVDGFLELQRSGTPVDAPEVKIAIPTSDTPSALVSVRDNGPGMSAEKLERAVRAGYSTNDPINNLGLFGMGFNIATARLGTVTSVWSTREGDPEWIGVRIDFDALQAQGHFRTQALTRAKSDSADHGTEVIVEKLKPEQRQWLSKPANKAKLVKELGRVYSAMLRTNGNPLSFRLKVNSKLVIGRQHCVWGGEGNADRIVSTPRFGDVNAYQTINLKLKDRPFCTKCWQWLSRSDADCPLCGSKNSVTPRKRAIRGWIGLQRYLHENEYGIDFLRHGRKIEIATKELFYWQDGELNELEYPIDDPRGRGRFVGEIHLDHCRVSYTKDRFDRNDPAWEEMLGAVRGEGPLRPDKAAAAGYAGNDSPLYKLFQVFRRSTPKSRVAGNWARLLVVPNNDRAVEMADQFHGREPAYQTDAKWWELVEEADKALLKGGGSSTAPAPGAAAAPSSGLPGFGQPAATATGATPSVPAAIHTATPIPSLTSIHRSETTDLKWEVKAFAVAPDHPQLGGPDRPWEMRRLTTGEFEFYVNVQHPIFLSATMTPLDGLLSQLAWNAADSLRESNKTVTFASILAELRERYAAQTMLDITLIATAARQTLSTIASTVAPALEANDPRSLFDSLPATDRHAIQIRMATKRVGSTQSVIDEGRFLEYAAPRVLLDFFDSQPELFLDGRCWDDVYATLDYGNPTATEEAQRQISQYYAALLADAVWAAEQDAGGIEEHGKARVLRAQLALELLAPTPSAGND